MQRINLTKYTTNSMRSVHYCTVVKQSLAKGDSVKSSHLYGELNTKKIVLKTLKYASMLCNYISSGKFTVKSSSIIHTCICSSNRNPSVILIQISLKDFHRKLVTR